MLLCVRVCIYRDSSNVISRRKQYYYIVSLQDKKTSEENDCGLYLIADVKFLNIINI